MSDEESSIFRQIGHERYSGQDDKWFRKAQDLLLSEDAELFEQDLAPI